MNVIKKFFVWVLPMGLALGSIEAIAGPSVVELDEPVWFCDNFQAAVTIDNFLLAQGLKWNDERVRSYAESQRCDSLNVGTRLKVLNAETIQRGDVQVRIVDTDDEGYIPELLFQSAPFQVKLSEETIGCTTVGAWAERMGGRLNNPRPGDIKAGQRCVELPVGTVIFKEPKTKYDRFYRVYTDDKKTTQYWFRLERK